MSDIVTLACVCGSVGQSWVICWYFTWLLIPTAGSPPNLPSNPYTCSRSAGSKVPSPPQITLFAACPDRDLLTNSRPGYSISVRILYTVHSNAGGSCPYTPSTHSMSSTKPPGSPGGPVRHDTLIWQADSCRSLHSIYIGGGQHCISLRKSYTVSQSGNPSIFFLKAGAESCLAICLLSSLSRRR